MSLTLITTHGKLKFELYCEKTPKTCKNFLALCASGLFDSTIFHRLMYLFKEDPDLYYKEATPQAQANDLSLFTESLLRTKSTKI